MKALYLASRDFNKIPLHRQRSLKPYYGDDLLINTHSFRDYKKKETKENYKVLADLILCFSKSRESRLYYNLVLEESTDPDHNFIKNFATEHLEILKSDKLL